jgi:hypothetical protein
MNFPVEMMEGNGVLNLLEADLGRMFDPNLTIEI